MTGARDHEELDVWQLANDFRIEVRKLLQTPALRADFPLFDQLRRSAESPCPNLAEGFSRFHPRDNASFARAAKGSLSESIDHLKAAVAKGYLRPEEIASACQLARRARGAATRYIRYLESPKALENARRAGRAAPQETVTAEPRHSPREPRNPEPRNPEPRNPEPRNPEPGTPEPGTPEPESWV